MRTGRNAQCSVPTGYSASADTALNVSSQVLRSRQKQTAPPFARPLFAHTYAIDTGAAFDTSICNATVSIERAGITVGSVKIKRRAYGLLIMFISWKQPTCTNAVKRARCLEAFASWIAIHVKGARSHTTWPERDQRYEKPHPHCRTPASSRKTGGRRDDEDRANRTILSQLDTIFVKFLFV